MTTNNDHETDGALAAHADNDVLVDLVDVEEYARRGEKPPKAKAYRIRVNREPYVFHESHPTREQILEKAGLTPVAKWTLRLKLHGGSFDRIEPGERVDLTRPGVEKFKALPNDQTEG